MSAAARALLLDIEGTTTPIDFVVGTLFPFARARVRAFLAAHAGEPTVQEDVARLRAEHARETEGPPPWGESVDGVAAYVEWLMDRDRKSTGLKSLQGRIWREGYASGELRGAVYEDVPRAFVRWRAQGRRLAIFSSGSVEAQRLLFHGSTVGDLTPWLEAYFDTTTGPKGEAASYAAIAGALGLHPSEVLFLSDVVAELDAARTAGLSTRLVVRGLAPSDHGHAIVRSFDEVFPETAGDG